MKLGERFIDNHDGTFTVQKQYSNDPYINKVQHLRHVADVRGEDLIKGEKRLAGIIPMHVMAEWFKEAGVSWSDREACREVMKRKLLSGDFDKLRVWEGKF